MLNLTLGNVNSKIEFTEYLQDTQIFSLLDYTFFVQIYLKIIKVTCYLVTGNIVDIKSIDRF